MKNIFKLFVLLFNIVISFGQNNLDKTDDFARIQLSTFVSEKIDGFPSAAKNLLKNKLSKIATINGLGGTQNSRFIITSNISVLFQEVLPGPPRKVALTLEVNFYIGDGIEGTLFSSETMTIKGVGNSDTKAYIAALKQIKTKNPIFQDFLNNGKTKIIEFYNDKCDFVLKNAEMQANKNDFDAAIATLTSIPEVCKDCYEKAMSSVQPIFQKKIDRQCKLDLAEAKNIWNVSLDASAAEKASVYLAKIDPNSSCYNDALNFSNVIAKRINDLDKREWNFKMKVQQDNVNLQNASIKAARDIGVAYAKNQPKVVYNIRGWW